MRCKEVTEVATAYAEGQLDLDTRQGFELHLATCAGCQTWVEQLEITVRLVRSLPPPEIPAGLRDQLLRQFIAWHAARAAGEASIPEAPRTKGTHRFAWEALVAISGVVAAFIGLARNPSRAAGDWVTSLALAAVAMVFAVMVRRLTLRFALAAVSASLVAALIRGGPGQVAVFVGMECLLIEAAAAVVLTGAAWLVSGRAAASASLEAWAVAGALAGDAALQVACREHTSLAHLVTFHAGGVLAIAALVLVVGGMRPAKA